MLNGAAVTSQSKVPRNAVVSVFRRHTGILTVTLLWSRHANASFVKFILNPKVGFVDGAHEAKRCVCANGNSCVRGRVCRAGCSSAAFLVLFLGPEGPPDRQVQITSFALCFQPISRGHAVCGGSGMTCTIPVLSNSGSTSDFERS